MANNISRPSQGRIQAIQKEGAESPPSLILLCFARKRQSNKSKSTRFIYPPGSTLNKSIYNGDRTEWSTIQGVIGRVISKSVDCNKIREDHDSSIDFLTG